MVRWSRTQTKRHNLNVSRLLEQKRCVLSLTESSAQLARRSPLAELFQLLRRLLSLGRVGEFLQDLLEEKACVSDVLQFGESQALLEHRRRHFGVLRILLDHVVESHNSWIVLFLGRERFPDEILHIPCLWRLWGLL